jgi:hypothetical protein
MLDGLDPSLQKRTAAGERPPGRPPGDGGLAGDAPLSEAFVSRLHGAAAARAPQRRAAAGSAPYVAGTAEEVIG